MRVRANNPPAREATADKEPLGVRPAKNRLMQVGRPGGRKLFDAKRKEAFLEWFAATCNVRLSAGKAGVHEKTVYKHLLKDPAFEEAFGRALRLGYLRLEARTVQEAHAPPLPAHAAHESPSPARGEGLQVSILDDELAEEHFDPQLALHLLREHARRLPGSREPKKAGAAPQSASSKEVAEALAKRLKGFALRARNEKAPPPSCGWSPSPGNPGEDE